MNETNTSEYGYEINPVYSQTRHVKINRETLWSNRVVSLFNGNAVSDQLKIMDTQVLDSLTEKKGNSLIITSPGTGEGKTLTSINLAISLSQKVDRTVFTC